MQNLWKLPHHNKIQIMNQINVKPDLKAAEQTIRKHLRRFDNEIRAEKKVEKKLRKGLTLRSIWNKLFSAVRKNPNTKKVMMTTEQILKEIESVPRHHITYTRQDGRTNEYTVAITERHADHIIGYKFQNGESCGIRRFNIDQIGILEPVS